MKRAALAGLLGLIAAPAAAQTASEPPGAQPPVQGPAQQMVVTATRIPTPLVDIPAGVTVIDRRTIEERDYTTLAEALQSVPGLHIAQSGGAGGNASVFIRGTNSNHVLVLRDGMPINDASDPGGLFNFGIETLADVERIEIIRGPMASLYGSGAIGGVINLISRQGSGAPHVTGDLSGGYPRSVVGDANLSGRSGLFDYSATVQTQSLRGYDVTPKREVIYTGVPDGYRDQTVTLNLGLNPVEGTRLFALLRASTTAFGFNALGAPTFDNANSSGHVDTFLGRIGGTSKLFGGSYETGVYLGRLQDDRHFTEPLNPADPNLAFNDSRYHGYRIDLQWNNTVHLGDFITLPQLSRADLTFGLQRTQDRAVVRVNSVSGGFPYSSNVRASTFDDAGYAGLQAVLLNRLTVTGQIREDSVQDTGSAFTWRLGAVLDVPEIRTHFKGAYGTAFRAPSLFDRFGVDSTGFVGNPNLKPERAQGWEVGFTTDLPLPGRPGFASFGATYFNEQVTNLIETVFDPVFTSVNIGSAHMTGVEVELTLRPVTWIDMTASYTYVNARDADTQSQLLRRPYNQAAFDLTARPLPKLTIVPELLYTGPFKDFLVLDSGFSDGVGTARQGLILNLTITYAVTPKISLFANGRNLTNSHFEPVSGFATPGPSFLAGARVRF